MANIRGLIDYPSNNNNNNNRGGNSAGEFIGDNG